MYAFDPENRTDLLIYPKDYYMRRICHYCPFHTTTLGYFFRRFREGCIISKSREGVTVMYGIQQSYLEANTELCK